MAIEMRGVLGAIGVLGVLGALGVAGVVLIATRRNLPAREWVLVHRAPTIADRSG